jgi:hypothetical protein
MQWFGRVNVLEREALTLFIWTSNSAGKQSLLFVSQQLSGQLQFVLQPVQISPPCS